MRLFDDTDIELLSNIPCIELRGEKEIKVTKAILTRDDCRRFNDDFKKYKTNPRVHYLYDIVTELNSAESELTVFKPESADSLLKVWAKLRGEIKQAIDTIKKREDGDKKLTMVEELNITSLVTARTMLDTEIKLQRLMKSKINDEKSKKEWRCVQVGTVVAVAVGLTTAVVVYLVPPFCANKITSIAVKIIIVGVSAFGAYSLGMQSSKWIADFFKCYENSNKFKRELHLMIQQIRLLPSEGDDSPTEDSDDAPSSLPSRSEITPTLNPAVNSGQIDTLSQLLMSAGNPAFQTSSSFRSSLSSSGNGSVSLEIRNPGS